MVKDIKAFIGRFYNIVGWPAIAFAVIVCGKVLGFGSQIFYPLYYVALLFAVIYNLRHGLKFDFLFIAFLLSILLSILLNDIRPVFNVWDRFLFFIFLSLAVSSLINNENAIEFRLKAIVAILVFCTLISVVSFGCYFLGINLVKNLFGHGYLDYVTNTAGTFGGITSHSMLLGPISGFAALFCLYLALRYNRMFYFLVVACLGSLLFSASRSSVLATIAGICILLLFYNHNIGKNTKRIIVILFAAMIAYPVWSPALKGINAKNQGEITSGIDISSRASKWEIRLQEWEESPLYGIGFCSVSETDDVSYGGKIEPGSSWLAVLSMTGALGLILFTTLYLKGLKHSLMQYCPEGSLLGGLLTLCGVHMAAEGHIFSAGSFLCLFFWLTLACASEFDETNMFVFENE